MSRENRRRRDAAGEGTPPQPEPVEPEQPEVQEQPARRPLLRREREVIPNAPGYASPMPWSPRGTLTLFALMVVINFPVAAVQWKLDSALTYGSAVVGPSVFLYLLYALLAMPMARRLAGESRSMRTLETVSTAALSYLVYLVAANLVAHALSSNGVDSRNTGQVALVGIAGLAGGAIGAALYPVVYRKLWMPRLPGARR